VRLATGGRLVLPAPLGRTLRLSDGEILLVEQDGTSIRLTPLRESIESFQAFGRDLFAGARPAEELIRERREEAARESG